VGSEGNEKANVRFLSSEDRVIATVLRDIPRWGTVQRPLALCLLLAAAAPAAAGDIPIVSLGDAGPDQEIPTDRSFYVRGDLGASVEHAQAIVVRRGSPSMFGTDGPSCHNLIADLGIETTLSSAAVDDSDDEAIYVPVPRYDSGIHRAFEVFANSTGAVRKADVLISAAWQRSSPDQREFKVLVPHDTRFFSAGYGYCLVIATTEHAQEVDEATLADLVDGVASKIVACGDKSSCDDDALAEYEVKVARVLANTDSFKRTPGQLGTITSMLEEAARVELGHAAGIVEVLGHMSDRFYDKTNVMPPAANVVWADIATDPFAQAVANLLTHDGALLPQVRGPQQGVALFTPDGKLQVKTLQLLDDGRSIRVAASKAPTGVQARVLTATTDTLHIADGLTLYDLIQLGNRRIRVSKDWITLKELGDGISQLGQEQWMPEDSTFLVKAHAQLKRLSDFVDLTTSGVTCTPHTYAASEAEQTSDAIRRQLGDWLVCQKVDAAAIETMREQVAALIAEDEAWKTAKAKVVSKSRRIVTLTSTAPTPLRVSFASRTWLFSYVTPIVGYAGVLRPDESFGLFYLGAQVHLDPNPVDDVQWKHGMTTKDLRRAIALELGVAPYESSFGPDMRFGGPGSLPPLFIGAAVHVLPYTSLTFGGAIVERRNSTLAQEEPHTVFAPYLGVTLQLNIPDMIRSASGPTTDTAASR
jgi:hypothetical protein